LNSELGFNSYSSYSSDRDQHDIKYVFFMTTGTFKCVTMFSLSPTSTKIFYLDYLFLPMSNISFPNASNDEKYCLSYSLIESDFALLFSVTFK